MHFSLFSIYIIVTLSPTSASPSPWNLFGFNSDPELEFPTQDGECSHWTRNNPFYVQYDSEDLTGFHRTIPIGDYVRVVNEVTGREVRVRIVGDGPIADGRVMELSPAAFADVSRLSEVVFPCRVFPPINGPGTGGMGMESNNNGNTGNGYGDSPMTHPREPHYEGIYNGHGYHSSQVGDQSRGGGYFGLQRPGSGPYHHHRHHYEELPSSSLLRRRRPSDT